MTQKKHIQTDEVPVLNKKLHKSITKRPKLR